MAQINHSWSTKTLLNTLSIKLKPITLKSGNPNREILTDMSVQKLHLHKDCKWVFNVSITGTGEFWVVLNTLCNRQ